MKKRNCKKIIKFCCALFLLVSITSFAQDSTISITPKEFKNTIALKTDFKEKKDISVIIYQGNQQVKQLNFTGVIKKSFKIDLKDLVFGKEYEVKVYNVKNELLYSSIINKTLKY